MSTENRVFIKLVATGAKGNLSSVDLCNFELSEEKLSNWSKLTEEEKNETASLLVDFIHIAMAPKIIDNLLTDYLQEKEKITKKIQITEEGKLLELHQV